MPVELYKKASNDYELRRVTPLNTCGGCKLTVTGQFCICVWRDDFKCQLDCKLVDNNVIRPLLGRNANVGMTIIAYFDNAANKKFSSVCSGKHEHEPNNAFVNKQRNITREMSRSLQ